MTGYRIAVPAWVDQDDIAHMFVHELKNLHHEPVCFRYFEPVPKDIDILMTFGPYDKILPLWKSVATRESRRPFVLHWNTEGIPDIRVPYRVVQWIGALRSFVSRLSQSESAFIRKLSTLGPISQFDQRMARYRYVGDYDYAFRQGWLHVLSDSSVIYSKIRTQAGIPTLYAPWGGSSVLYNDLGLERDIDLLWIGKRGSGRRGRILDKVFNELQPYGLKIHVADNVQNPFIFGRTRTEYLNRTKITLNVTRTWYDDNFSRFALASPNRSLIVSEPVLPHCIEFKPGVHYVSAPISQLSKTILYFLEHDQERERIADQAFDLVTQELLFCESIKKMVQAVERLQAGRQNSNNFFSIRNQDYTRSDG